ncbi:MAG: hypothetical protein F4X35_00870 [Alphaproteobacteria bacterium]|nr:hypothetical protein [Alphaproteobacteria bacterium]
MTDTAGTEMVNRIAPDAPETVRTKAASRIDAYLAKSYDKINLGRAAPPGVLVKSGAASLLQPWRNPSGGIIGD